MAAKEKQVSKTKASVGKETVPLTGNFVSRYEEGKALRQQVPRWTHAEYEAAAQRSDPLDLLSAQDRTRLHDLIPIRYGRMVTSAFAFYRGSATVMAHDLVSTPVSGIKVQACGDAHLCNFGSFATPERNQVFDINDFDETLPAPWEWDVKRLAASMVIASRANGFKAADCTAAAVAAVREYREKMASFASMGNLAVWYNRIGREDVVAATPKKVGKDLERGLSKAVNRNNVQVLAKIASKENGLLRIVDDAPLIMHISDAGLETALRTLAKTYRSSIRDDLKELLNRYTFVDFAIKVVGVGSVGTRCYVALFEGNHDGDPLFLQIKEAFPSVLEPFAGKSKYHHHGQRVVRGQQFTQAASDIFLGWGRVLGMDFYVRQLRDMKASVEVTLLPPDRMEIYGGLCGWALARAHARSGDAARIAGYLGDTDEFDLAIAKFANAYADQTERDHAALQKAVKSGRIAAVTGR